MQTRRTATIIMMVVTLLTLLLAASYTVAGPPVVEEGKGSGKITTFASLSAGLAGTVASSISYQGQLTDAVGNPLSGSYDMIFQIWDAETSGQQLDSDIAAPGVPVDQGLFDVELPVNPFQFNGRAIWLRIEVDGTWLSPRQPLLPVPYALSLRPGAVISDTLAGDMDTAVLYTANKGAGAVGLWANGDRAAVHAWSINGTGVLGTSENGFGGDFSSENSIAVYGATGSAEPAIWGENTAAGPGVMGTSASAAGVIGESQAADQGAVIGLNGSDGPGVHGQSQGGPGVLGRSDNGPGVAGYGECPDCPAVHGLSGGDAPAVQGESDNSVAILGHSANDTGVRGESDNEYGVFGDGDIYGVVTPAKMLAPAYDVGSPDLAEFYPAATADLEPGDVVALDPAGGLKLRRADSAYDTAAAGIVSEKPGLTLGVKDGKILPGSNAGEVPLALAGRVRCKVDAKYGGIEVGDLLTTSPTPGHAMRVSDPLRAVGATIGKALEPWDQGTGTILVLVMLR